MSSLPYVHPTSMMTVSLWNMLPEEIKDVIFMYTDLDTAILHNRTKCVNAFLRVKRIKRPFTWSNAASQGNLVRLKYLFREECRDNHAPHLIHLALINGHLETAEWLWSNRTAIRILLYPKLHQRNHNRLIRLDTLQRLVDKSKFQESMWFLEHTSAPFEDTIFYKLDSLSVCQQQDIMKSVMVNLKRMHRINLGSFNTRQQLLFRLKVMRFIHEDKPMDSLPDLIFQVFVNI